MLTITTRIPLYLSTVLLMCVINSNTFAAKTTRVSVTSNGKQADDESTYPVISANGRYVVFISSASNLVAGADDQKGLFIKDILTSKIEQLAMPHSFHLDIHALSLSSDARYIAIISSSYCYIRIYDRLTQKTTQPDTVFDGYKGSGRCGNLSISADGRYVGFTSTKKLIGNKFSRTADDTGFYVHDLIAHKTIKVGSAALDGSLSADGRHVAFTSKANLVLGDTNDHSDVFVYDLTTHETIRVSVSKNGQQGNSDSYAPKISANGQVILFASEATNLTNEPINKQSRVYSYDFTTHKTNREDFYGDISADGRYVLFSEFEPSIANNWSNSIFVYDRLTHIKTRINVDLKGKPAASVAYNEGTPSISADGRYVAFASGSSKLVAGDTNDTTDIFVRDRLLDTSHHADLKIVDLKGGYIFGIYNNGSDTVNDVVLLEQVFSGKSVEVKLTTPHQGQCSPAASIVICHLGKLAAGKNKEIIAFNFDKRQLTVSGEAVDIVPANNNLHYPIK